VENSSLISPLTQVPTDLLTSQGSRLEDKIRIAQSSTGAGQKQALKKVSQEFEAIFIGQLLKVMRETIEESGLFGGGFGKSIYTELFDQEISLSMARRGALGISDLLYRNLADKAPDATQTEKEKAAPDVPSAVPSIPSGPSEEDNEISDFQLPVHAPISSLFGLRKDPFTHQVRFHKGLDLSAPEGMKVVSALAGTVISAGYEHGYGNTVLMQHDGGIQTRYGHLGSIKVKAGDVVESEAELGTVGTTGRSTGPHLHFEVIRMGKPVDPLARFSLQAASSAQSSGHPRMGS
jgi:murein DD-endopeptidase MepM/ murein hydrolase activator NlpD